MTNDELKEAIVDTINHIKLCSPQAERMSPLNVHLVVLLKEQQRRALERDLNPFNTDGD